MSHLLRFAEADPAGMSRTGRRVSFGRASSPVLILLLLVLAAQLVAQLHELGHSAEPEQEVCQSCLTGGGLDSVVPPSGKGDVSHSTKRGDRAQPVTEAGSEFVLSYAPRAPPSILRFV